MSGSSDTARSRRNLIHSEIDPAWTWDELAEWAVKRIHALAESNEALKKHRATIQGVVARAEAAEERVDSLEAEKRRLETELAARNMGMGEAEARVDVLTEVAQAAQALIDVEDRIEESGRDDVDGRWNAYAKLESVLAAVGVPPEQTP